MRFHLAMGRTSKTRCSMVSGVMRESAKDGFQGKVARRKRVSLPGAGIYPDAFSNKNQRMPCDGGAGGASLRIHSLDRTLDGVKMDKQKEGSAHMTLSVLSLTSRIWGRSRCRSRCLWMIFPSAWLKPEGKWPSAMAVKTGSWHVHFKLQSNQGPFTGLYVTFTCGFRMKTKWQTMKSFQDDQVWQIVTILSSLVERNAFPSSKSHAPQSPGDHQKSLQSWVSR